MNDLGLWGAAGSSETLVALYGVFEKWEIGEENLDALIRCHHVACLHCDTGCNFCNVLLVVHTNFYLPKITIHMHTHVWG